LYISKTECTLFTVCYRIVIVPKTTVSIPAKIANKAILFPTGHRAMNGNARSHDNNLKRTPHSSTSYRPYNVTTKSIMLQWHWRTDHHPRVIRSFPNELVADQRTGDWLLLHLSVEVNNNNNVRWQRKIIIQWEFYAYWLQAKVTKRNDKRTNINLVIQKTNCILHKHQHTEY